MIKVYFETSSHVELVAAFSEEDVFEACRPFLGKLAREANMILTESMENKEEQLKRDKELSLLCCIIRENEIIDSTLFQSFDKIFKIAEAFIDKYGVDEIEWGEEMEYEETVVEFSTLYAINNLGIDRAFL